MTAEALGSVLTMLDTQRYMYLLTGLLKVKTPEQRQNLSKYQVVALAIMDWLAHLGFDSSQQERVFAFLPDNCDALTSLVVADGRYVTYKLADHAVSQVFDLYLNELSTGFPEPVVTHFVCNVPQLYKRVVAAAGQTVYGRAPVTRERTVETESADDTAQ